MFRRFDRWLSRFALPLLAATILSGCGGGNEAATRAEPPTVTRGMIEPFKFVFSTTKSTFNPGESVPLTVTVTNTGPEIVSSGGGAGAGAGNRVNALIERGGTRVWRQNGICFDDYRENNWRAGEKRNYSFTWGQRNEGNDQVAPGTYRITPFVPKGVSVAVQDPHTYPVAPALEITIRE